MSDRVESPSSINMYLQCPRKYWYRYIKKLPGKATIHTTRGNIVHDVLEEFFHLEWKSSSYESCKQDFNNEVEKLLVKYWTSEKYQREMQDYNLNDEEKKYYFENSLFMLIKWTNRFAKDVNKLKGILPFIKAFHVFAPHYTEREYFSEKWGLRGKIDAVHKFQGETIVRDYKTSSRTNIDDKLMMQASVYALLYLSTHKESPSKVCFDFLKFSPKYIEVTKEMLNNSINEIKKFHKATSVKEVNAYPKKTSPLCKWRTGQCDYYDICDPYEKLGKGRQETL